MIIDACAKLRIDLVPLLIMCGKGCEAERSEAPQPRRR